MGSWWQVIALDLGTIGFLLAALAYAALSVVLVIGWRDRSALGALLIGVAALSVLSAAVAAWQNIYADASISLTLVIELLRDAGWVGFLWGILRRGGSAPGSVPRAIDAIAIGAGILVVGSIAMLVMPERLVIRINSPDFLLFAKAALILAVLVMTEHLYRYTTPQRRWAIKYLCLAIAGTYLFDFYKYTEALLFRDAEIVQWEARGYIHALVVPLIAVSAARNPLWRLDVYVSRKLVFHTTVIITAGIYLIVMAVAGYYLRFYGGDWGRVTQVVLLFTTLLLLMAVALSAQARAKLRVFISKHFFNYRYDYREEWLRMTRTLVSGVTGENLPTRAIRALADIVESPGGQLWLRKHSGLTVPTESWNWNETIILTSKENESLERFLLATEWVIEMEEYRRHPERYRELKLPQELLSAERLWLIVPLLHERALVGLVLLMPSRTTNQLNWEDRDILKVAAREVAGYLAQSETLRALTEARQFEGFNRLSAYVIHDLKNLIAQLSLVVSNAKRHSDNPEFLRDAIGTVENSVERMNRLLVQLRNGVVPGESGLTDLAQVVHEAVEICASRAPLPKMEKRGGAILVEADRERLLSVIKHLIQNAQEATSDTGSVVVRVWHDNRCGFLEVEDNGCGMAEEFVRDRLFRPFDTTKGLTGMGIGAFEGREMFRALGGDITVQSELNKGTRIRCHVVLVDDAPDAVIDTIGVVR